LVDGLSLILVSYLKTVSENIQNVCKIIRQVTRIAGFALLRLGTESERDINFEDKELLDDWNGF